MYQGFSSYQTIFGRNPSFPSENGDVDVHDLNVPKGDKLRQHLNLLYQARKSFVEGMSSNQIQRALRHKIRDLEHKLQPGNEVFYKYMPQA